MHLDSKAFETEKCFLLKFKMRYNGLPSIEKYKRLDAFQILTFSEPPVQFSII